MVLLNILNKLNKRKNKFKLNFNNYNKKIYNKKIKLKNLKFNKKMKFWIFKRNGYNLVNK